MRALIASEGIDGALGSEVTFLTSGGVSAIIEDSCAGSKALSGLFSGTLFLDVSFNVISLGASFPDSFF
ncbi:MAG: hypothetical protein NC238_05225 [Dehalobacter sp.]|nr:hypothetical protein [Dehalobacter sp.]